jgi:hypothetical protein
VFYLPKYSMTPGTFAFSVTVMRTDLSASSAVSETVRVTVVSAGLSASIYGGDAQSLRAGGSISLDASGSVDNDIADTSQAGLGLSYQWHCNKTSPVVGSDCGVRFVSGSVVAVYSADASAFNTTNRITLVVRKDSRSASTYVLLQVVPASAAVISISGSSVASGSKFVTSNKFTVSGVVSSELACTAAWSVVSSVGTVDVSTTGGNVLSTVTTSIGALSSGVSVSLVLAANALPPMATVQFALSCGSAVASVTVVTNGCPQGGSYTVSPGTGVALTTSFTLAASSWVDADVPLTYQYWMESAGGSLLELRRPLTVETAVMSLPAGTGTSGVATTVLRVFDSYGSWSGASYNVTVAALAASALTAVLSSQLSVNVSTDVDGAKLAVTLVTASLNGASCSGDCSSQELSSRQVIRDSLLGTLYSVSTADVVDAVSLSSMASSLAAITQVPTEISEAGIAGTFKVAQSLLMVANASSVTMSQASVVNVLESLSSVTVAGSAISSTSASGFSLLESTSTMVSLVELCNDMILSTMAYGEASVSSVYGAFATTLTSVTVADENVVATVGSSSSSSGSASSISIPVTGSASVKMSAMSTQSWAYGSNRSLVSETVTVSVSLASGSLSEETSVMLVLELSEEVETVVIPSKYNFTEHCAYGEFKTVEHECPDTGTVVEMNCTGGMEVVTAECPGLKKEAECGSAIGDSSLSCVLMSSSESSLTCSCVLKATSSGSRMRRLASSSTSADSVLQQAGVSHVAALTTYVGEEFAGTLTGAAGMNSAAALRRALIVIVAFIVLWAGGFTIVMSAAFRSKAHSGTHKEQAATFERLKKYAQATRSPVAIAEYLRNYVDEVFPSAFKDRPNLDCLFDEILKHHRYVLVLTCSNDKKADQNRIVTAVRLLTVQTMLMFLLAVFYDLQAPSDDGSCAGHATAQSCLSRKSIIQTDSTYCKWSENVLHDMECSYRDPAFSYLTIAYVSVLISVITAFLTSPIDICFQYLTAPTADSLKLNSADSLTKRLMERAKRASISALKMVGNTASRATVMEKRLEQLNFETREVPESTRLAHALAMAVVPFLISKSQSLLLKRVASSQKTKDKHQRMRHELAKNQDDDGGDSDDGDDKSADEVESVLEGSDASVEGVHSDEQNHASNHKDRGTPTTQSRASIFSGSLFQENSMVARKFQDLSLEVDLQRKALQGTEAEDFDSNWGIDPTGEFVKREMLSLTGYRHRNAADTIKHEIRQVELESNRIFEYLRYATDQHIGLEILHLFVLDVLGRDTAAARIFQSKSREDFFTVRVVSRRSKMLAWTGFILINLFFIYFIILKSYEKGTGWQRAFVAGSVVQILVEILFNETIECMWVNFLVPRLVSEEVHKVATILHTAITQLCVPESSRDDLDKHHVLDAPSYLFVSTAVARKFPNYLESMVVRAYHSHLPGMLANKWRFGPVSYIDHSHRSGVLGMLRTLSLTATVLAGLQIAAASPFILQRVVIRIAQPWLLTGIVVGFAYLIKRPVFLAVFCVIIAAGLGGMIYFSFHFRRRHKSGKIADERHASGEFTTDNGDDIHEVEADRLPVSTSSICVKDADVISESSEEGKASGMEGSNLENNTPELYWGSGRRSNDDESLSVSVPFSVRSHQSTSSHNSDKLPDNLPDNRPELSTKDSDDSSIEVSLDMPDEASGDEDYSDTEEEECLYNAILDEDLNESEESRLSD